MNEELASPESAAKYLDALGVDRGLNAVLTVGAARRIAVTIRQLSRDLEEARARIDRADEALFIEGGRRYDAEARIEVVEAALREAERLLPRLTPGNVAHIRGALMPQVRRALSPQTGPMSKSRAKRIAAQTEPFGAEEIDNENR